MKSANDYCKDYLERRKGDKRSDVILVGEFLQSFQKELSDMVENHEGEVTSDIFIEMVKKVDKKWASFAYKTGELNKHLYRVFIMTASPNTFLAIWTRSDVEHYGIYSLEKDKEDAKWVN